MFSSFNVVLEDNAIENYTEYYYDGVVISKKVYEDDGCTPSFGAFNFISLIGGVPFIVSDNSDCSFPTQYYQLIISTEVLGEMKVNISASDYENIQVNQSVRVLVKGSSVKVIPK